MGFFLKIKNTEEVWSLLLVYENVKPMKNNQISSLKISSLINIITFKIH
jgi:hypothetical protein